MVLLMGEEVKVLFSYGPQVMEVDILTRVTVMDMPIAYLQYQYRVLHRVATNLGI